MAGADGIFFKKADWSGKMRERYPAKPERLFPLLAIGYLNMALGKKAATRTLGILTISLILRSTAMLPYTLDCEEPVSFFTQEASADSADSV